MALALAAALIGCGSDTVDPGAGPISVAHSVVSISKPTVISGTAAQLRLEARDAFDQQLTAGGSDVAFQVSGGTSSGSVGPVTDLGDGSYTALFTGMVAGTPATVGATIDGSPVTRPLPTVQVLPGPISPVVSTVSVSPATILVGATATIELVTRDAQGNDLGVGGRQVAFAVTDGTSQGAIGPTTDHGDGRYTAAFTATGHGTPLTVSASVDGVPVTTPPPTLTVAAGVSPDSSTVELSSDTVSMGGGVTLTLRVIDSAGVARTSGGETVVFSVVTGPATGQGSIDSTTDHDDGTYTANFTASSPGAVTIEVTLAGQVVGGPAPLITILADPISPQHSSIAVSDDTVAAGSTALLTLVVRDLDSSQVKTGGLVVDFTATDGLSTGAIGSTTDHGDGTYTASFTAHLAGTATTIGATINDSSQVQMLDSVGVSHLPTIAVIPGPQSVDSTLFSVFPSAITLGDSARLLMEVRDGQGNPVGQGGRTASFDRVGGVGVSVGTIGPVADHGNGTYSAYYRADSAGTADTLTATLDGASLASARPVISVVCIAGPVSATVSELTINDTTAAQKPVKSATVPSGVSTTITVRIRDDVGCPITTPHAVVVTLAGGTSTGLLGPVVDQGDGTYTVIVTGVLAGTPTGVGTTIDGSPVVGLPVTMRVIPGDISPETSSVTISPAEVDSGAHATATLQARDAAGNDLVTGGRQVTVFISGAVHHGALSQTVDLGDGRHAAIYTGAVVEPGVADLVTANIEGTPIATAPASIEVVAGTISPDRSLVTASAGTIVVGDSILVTLMGKDASGRALVTGDRTVPIAFSFGGGTSTGSFGTVQNQGDGSYTAWLQGLLGGTPSTISVTIGGSAVTTPLPMVVVLPNP